MARYPKQDDPKGKKVIPSVTQIISDCTDSSGPLTQWAANMCKEWIVESCPWSEWEDDISKGYFQVRDTDLDEMRFNFRKVSQKALDIGSEVHNAIEMHLQGKEYALTTKEAENAFQAFLSWADEHNLKPIALEQTVYGNVWAGTLDFYGYFDDKLYVIDWKSSKAHYPEMRYQVAAYRWAIEKDVLQDCHKEAMKQCPDAGAMITKFRETYSTLVKINGIKGSGILRLDKETGLPDWKDHSKTYEQDLAVFNAMVDLYFLRHPRIAKQARGE